MTSTTILPSALLLLFAGVLFLATHPASALPPVYEGYLYADPSEIGADQMRGTAGKDIFIRSVEDDVEAAGGDDVLAAARPRRGGRRLRVCQLSNPPKCYDWSPRPSRPVWI
ncbi:unnamed protein product [Dibothriocephalus latus]|uniref:Uncharacterized protein n=1 Tax=Dibothriocephalus latus TaxID=60516 RepID=A0A3P6QFJ4_DIBLA|nr:unnamed protein product [Dibothriocephalus latus]